MRPCHQLASPPVSILARQLRYELQRILGKDGIILGLHLAKNLYARGHLLEQLLLHGGGIGLRATVQEIRSTAL